jgi:hypothetical protein
MNTGVKYYFGDRLVVSGSNVTKPTGMMAGAILHEVGTNKQFLLTGNNVWAELSPVGLRYRWNSPTGGWAAGTIIGLSGDFTYNTGTNSDLFIYLNGSLQFKDTTTNSADNDYSQKNTTGISFNFNLQSGSVVDFVKYR